MNLRRAVLLFVLVCSVGPALSATRPRTYILEPESTEVHRIAMNPATNHTEGFVVANVNADPDLSNVEIYARDDATGTFSLFGTIPVPNLYRICPVLIENPTHHNIFIVTKVGNTLSFAYAGIGGTVTPIAPDYTGGSNFTGGQYVLVGAEMTATSGGLQGVAYLVEPNKVLAWAPGPGGLQPYEQVLLAPGTQGSVLHRGDVNGDNKDDLLVADDTNDVVIVALNTTPLRSFQVAQTLAVANIVNVMGLDAGADGLDDLVAVTGTTTPPAAQMSVYTSAGGGTPFGSPSSTLQLVPGSVALGAGQLFGDTLDDVFVASQGSAIGFLQEASNDGAGGFTLTGIYQGVSGASHVIVASREFVGVFDSFQHQLLIWQMGNNGLGGTRYIAAGAGWDPNTGPVVYLYRADGVEMIAARFAAYATSGYGVRIGAANVNDDCVLHACDELLTGPGSNPVFGSHVRGWARVGTAFAPMGKINFFAYGTQRYGVRADGANLDADVYDEIITGAGPGAVFGPHVRGFNCDNGGATAIGKVNFFGYSTLKWGVNVTAGDIDQDGYEEIATGPGPGDQFGAQVRGWNVDGGATTSLAKVNFVAFAGARYGADVSTGDVESDGFDEIYVARGAGQTETAQFKGFDYDGASVSENGDDFAPFTTIYGGRLSLGDLDGDLSDETADIVMASGPWSGADTTLVVYAAGSTSASATWEAVPTATFGANVATLDLGL